MRNMCVRVVHQPTDRVCVRERGVYKSRRGAGRSLFEYCHELELIPLQEAITNIRIGGREFNVK